MPGRAALPLLAFQHHVGALYVDPAELRFICELGVGELALVEQAQWVRPGDKPLSVVVKGYKPYVIATPEDFRELLLEANKLQRLQHPHLCRFVGLGCFQHGSLAEVRSSIFMVEEFAGSRSLKKLLSEQARTRVKNLYSMRTALRWARQLAQALAYLHGSEPAYIHGDVKPDNVLLADGPLPRSQAKLGDLKPHRHIYDKSPSTLSLHLKVQPQQQQSSLRRYSSDHSGALDPAKGAGGGQPMTAAAGGFALAAPPAAMAAGAGAAAADGGGVEGTTLQRSSGRSNPVPIRRNSRSQWHGSATYAATAAGEEGLGEAKEEHGLGHRLSDGRRSMHSCGSFSPELLGSAMSAPPLSPTRSLPFDELSRAAAAAEAAEGSSLAAAAAALDKGSLGAGAGGGPRLSDSASTVPLGLSSGGSFKSPALHKEGSGGPLSWWPSGRPQHQQQQQEVLIAAAPAPEPPPAAAVVAGGSSGSEASAEEVQQAGEGGEASRDALALLQPLGAGEKQVHGQLLYQQNSSKLGSASSLEDGEGPCEEQLGARDRDRTASPFSGGLVKTLSQQLSSSSSLGRQLTDAEQQQHQGIPRVDSGDAWGCSNSSSRAKLSELEGAASAGAGSGSGGAGGSMTFDLTATGAANPSGLPQSALLDLFADMAEDGREEESRAALEAPCYISTIAPGSSIQQRVLGSPPSFRRQQQQLPGGDQPEPLAVALPSLMSISPNSSSIQLASAAEGGPMGLTRCNSPPGSFTGLSSHRSGSGELSGELSSGAGSEQGQGPVPVSTVACSGMPSAIESKQHGGSSALLALTAIDSIREETSSVAESSSFAVEDLDAEEQEGGQEQQQQAAAAASAAAAGDAEMGSGGEERSGSSKGSGHGGGIWPSLIGGLLMRRNTSDGEMGAAAAAGASDTPAGPGAAAGEAGKQQTGQEGEQSASRASSSSSCMSFCMAELEHEEAQQQEQQKQQQQQQQAAGGLPASAPAAAAAVNSPPPVQRLRSILRDDSRSKLITATSAATDASFKEGEAGRGIKDSLSSSNCSSLDPERSTSKRVRFTVERPEGVTASRDRSLLYTAPELMQGQRATVKVDVFAFGIVLYELLSRSLLSSWQWGPEEFSAWDEPRAMLRFAQRMSEGYRPPIPTHWPEPVAELVIACWAAEAHERPSMEEVERRLQALGDNSKVIAALDNFVLALADWERAAPSCGCAGTSCVIS